MKTIDNSKRIVVFEIHSYGEFWEDQEPESLSIAGDQIVEFGHDLNGEAMDMDCYGKRNVELLSRYSSNITPDIVVLYDRTNLYKCWKKLKEIGLLEKTIMVLNESGAVDWKCGSFFLKHFKDMFPAFLTYRDDFVDNKVFFRTFPIGAPIRRIDLKDGREMFEDKRLLCMICAKKKSHLPHEMYSERLKNILFFEKHPEHEFDLYGAWWGQKYKNWKGIAENKRDVYHNHKFALCIENSREEGYITEKIYDCFRFGIVPIYAGPSNVDKYIPQGCYIDYYQFSSLEDMVSYLRKMTEPEYKERIENARKYVESDALQSVYQNESNLYHLCFQGIQQSKWNSNGASAAIVGMVDSMIELEKKIFTKMLGLIRFKR